MDYEQLKRFTEQDVIEVVPLAYMARPHAQRRLHHSG